MAKRKRRNRRGKKLGRNGFRERDPADLETYRAEEVGKDLTRDELVDSMEALLSFTRGSQYEWDQGHDIEGLIYATVVRSARTFEGICSLLRSGLAVQAAMLCRSLFEDMVVGHWMFYNGKDPDWMVERFLRQREAIALHQRRLGRQTKAFMGPPIPMAKDAPKREQELQQEFGSEATRDWWNPGREGEGKGGDVKLRKLIGLLEDAAARQEMFHPRFAGGEAPLLRRTELVSNKWFNQCIHHTSLGLPFTLTDERKVEIPEDPMLVVSFNSTWLFAQQVYLAMDVARRTGREFEVVFWSFMLDFSRALDPGAKEVKKLESQLETMLNELGWDLGEEGDGN